MHWTEFDKAVEADRQRVQRSLNEHAEVYSKKGGDDLATSALVNGIRAAQTAASGALAHLDAHACAELILRTYPPPDPWGSY